MERTGLSVVIKIGGSLLSLCDLARRVQALLQRLGDGRFLIVAGGGAAVDLVRTWQPLHRLSDDEAHWLALRGMSLNEALLCQLLPGTAMAQSRAQIHDAWERKRLPILASESFMRAEVQHASDVLPHTWFVSSDSIAAWVARRLGFPRLVLLKSCDVPPNIDLATAAEQGFVDRHFPRCAAELSISWVNLRADQPQLIEWRTRQGKGSKYRGA